MLRREFLITCGALWVAPAYAAVEPRATLRLNRQPGWDRTCVACIPGELFAGEPLGPKLCDTVELPFEDNAVGRSAIPAGEYTARVVTARTKPWMTDELRAWRLELDDVSNRRAIQFHFGKESSWSRGCVIVGLNNSRQCQANACRFSDSPVEGVRALRDYVMARLRKSDDRVRIVIT
jgi:hypothetical protein